MKLIFIDTSLLGVLLILLISGTYAHVMDSTPPNVIVLLTDDQGYGDFGCHGNPLLKTPAMDQLHSESVRLTDFHVAPMCTPTRGQLLTGMDAMRNGATAVCQGRSMMRNGIPTMAEYFAEAGYATGHFGKWHLGDSYPHRPQDRGFQETLHHPAWGITSLADHFGNSYFDPWLRHAVGGGQEVDQPYKGYCTDIFFREGMRWMKEQKAQARPFFLYLPTNTPHVPNWVAEKFAKPYRKIGSYNGTEIPANFYGMIANIDANIAKLEKFLKREKLHDNTILIYLNDNGTQSEAAAEIYNAGMRGHKTQMYEGGHRVSCFIRWPNGELIHGADIPELTQVQDILPTLIDLCKLDEMNTLARSGTSLAGLLRGKQQKLPDRKLVIQYSFGETSGSKWNRAIVLWDKWRLVGPEELYDLRSDPHQDKNVIGDYPAVAKAMQQHYEDWYARTSPLFSRDRYISLGNEAANPTRLYANDWVGGYCDNPPNLVAANKTGYWDVIVEEAGEYAFELRRWPEESGLALTTGVQGETIKAHESFSGENVGARPIYTAKIQIGAFAKQTTPEAGASVVSFSTQLGPGTYELNTLFLDRDGKPLCSAIYVKVSKR